MLKAREPSVLARNQQWHMRDSGKVWNLPSLFQSSQTNWKCQWSSTTCMAYPWSWFVLLEQNWLPCGWWLFQQVPNCEENSKKFHTHGDKGIRDDLYRIWKALCAEEWQWTVLHFQGVLWLPRILQDSPYHKQPTLSTKQWICWSFGGYFFIEEVDGKVCQGWKTMELWSSWVQSYTMSGNLPSPLEALTGCKPRTSLPQIPSSVGNGNSVENSRICQEPIKRQPSTLTHYSMELEPGQPVFVKEVTGNVWKTGVVDQPAKEHESYWIKFPDNSILRRTRSMIKPRSQPSYFELEVEDKEWNATWTFPPCSHNPFSSKLTGQSEYYQCNQFHSHWQVQHSMTSSCQLVKFNLHPSTRHCPRWSTHSTKGIPPVRFTPSKQWALCALEHYGSQWKGYFCIVLGLT